MSQSASHFVSSIHSGILNNSFLLKNSVLSLFHELEVITTGRTGRTMAHFSDGFAAFRLFACIVANNEPHIYFGFAKAVNLICSFNSEPS